MTELGSPPRVPICRSAGDPTQPCKYAGVCHESRQRIQHYNNPPQRGLACWAFDALPTLRAYATLHGTELETERAAIQGEPF